MQPEQLLTQIIGTLSSSPDFRATVTDLARLGLELADWCGIYVFENENTVRRLSAAPAPTVEALFPLDLHSAIGPSHVRRTNECQVVAELSTDIIAALGLKPEEFVLSDGSKPSQYLCVPAVARQFTIGAVVLMSGASRHRFGSVEISLARSLANAAAVAMSNSKLYREAQEANRLKDEFVAMVSHELRTPLTPMLGCIHLLRNTKPNPQNFERLLEIIERNAQTQVHIVEDLLDASRIVAGKLHLVMKNTRLIPALESAIETVKSSAEAKSVNITADFEEVETPILADPDRLQQILWNLLSNAVKFTPPEGRVEISMRAESGYVRIQVLDTGVGIPPEFLPHIFDRFSQVAEGNAKMRSGLGLGLAIVRHLVELHNGSIEAASAGPGKGAVFTLRFPFAAPQRAAAATET